MSKEEKRKARKSEKVQIIILTSLLFFLIILFTITVPDIQRNESTKEEDISNNIISLCRANTPYYDYELIAYRAPEKYSSNMSITCLYYSQTYKDTKITRVKI